MTPVDAPPAYVVSVEALTEVPLSVGGRVTVEGPLRLRGSVSVGVLPTAYVDLLNTTATGCGWYDDTTASLISAALNDSVVVRTHLGWRPWAQHGFFFTVGYGLVALGGGLTGQDVIEALTGEESRAGENIALTAAATVHMIDVTAGWEWKVKHHFVLRVELGGAFTAAATAVIAPADELERGRAADAVAALTDEGEEWLETELTTWVHTPTVTLGAGWEF